MNRFEIDLDILSSFLCEEEMKYFIHWDMDWMNEIGGYGYDKVTNSILTYYITKTGHTSVNIPYDDYKQKYYTKLRDNKLESIGI